ncbi:MAG: hydroxymethylbilane synthase [Geodermatophilaceae bacterium]|nr:hydroxymethylbilane synthase [Geodermatophilaceae bacterium]
MSGRDNAIRIGTRPSRLAKAQAGLVAQTVRATSGRDVVLVEISTPGDASSAPITELSTVGVFVSSLRAALLRGEIDVAVHSYKDLPTASEPGLVIAAIPTREDPRDVLVASYGRNLLQLSPGSRVGTGSPRRTAQLNALQLGLDVVGIRGNVDTRLAAVTSGAVDAIVVARAGLARLGRLDEVTETLDPIQVLPAPAQGALAVECRSGSTDVLAVLAALDDPDARATVQAERALLASLDAGCTAPVGALCELADGEDGPELFLRANVTAIDGSAAVRSSAARSPDQGAELGRLLAAELLDLGAEELLGTRHTASTPSQATGNSAQGFNAVEMRNR